MIVRRKLERKNMCRKAVAEIRRNQYDLDSVKDAAILLQKEYNLNGPFPVVKMIVDAGFKIYILNFS